METTLDPLVADFVEWVVARPRRYSEAMEAWRTSCPRLTVWEEAFDRGYLKRQQAPDGSALVTATAAGLAFLRASGRPVIDMD